MADNFNFLRRETSVHIHADLIVGLPGETLESFAAGFDQLVALGPQEIQVGILKRLRGTPIVRHDAEWQMVYNAHPPYEILQNKLIDFATMQRLRRFAKYWDLVGNSGNFVETTPLVAQASSLCVSNDDQNRAGETPAPLPSPFANFLRLSDWLYARLGRTDTIALARLAELLFEFLTRRIDNRKNPPPPKRCGATGNAAAAATRRSFSANFCRPKASFKHALQNRHCQNARRGISLLACGCEREFTAIKSAAFSRTQPHLPIARRKKVRSAFSDDVFSSV